MYVAHTGADRVDVLDCERRAFLRSLPDLPGVAGVLIDEEHDLLFTSDRDAARVSVFRCSDEQLLGPGRGRPAPERARLRPPPPPPVRVQPRRAARRKLHRLGRRRRRDASRRRAAAARSPALGALRRGRVTASTRTSASRRRSLVIDAERIGDRARPSRSASAGPHGLWLDRGRLFCAADGGALVVLDRDSGDVLASLAASRRPRRRHARPGAAPPLRRDRRSRPRLQLRQRAARARSRRSRPSSARTRSAGIPSAAASTFSTRRAAAPRVFEESRLSPDARRIVAAQGARPLAYGLGSVLDRRHPRRRVATRAPQVGAVLAALLAGTALVSVAARAATATASAGDAATGCSSSRWPSRARSSRSRAGCRR